MPVLGRFVAGDPDAYTYLPQSVHRFPAPSELADDHAPAGLSGVQFKRLKMGVVAVHAGTVAGERGRPGARGRGRDHLHCRGRARGSRPRCRRRWRGWSADAARRRCEPAEAAATDADVPVRARAGRGRPQSGDRGMRGRAGAHGHAGARRPARPGAAAARPPTVWRDHGPTVATATGDYLFARAFAELVETGDMAAVSMLADACLCARPGRDPAARTGRRSRRSPTSEYLRALPAEDRRACSRRRRCSARRFGRARRRGPRRVWASSQRRWAGVPDRRRHPRLRRPAGHDRKAAGYRPAGRHRHAAAAPGRRSAIPMCAAVIARGAGRPTDVRDRHSAVDGRARCPAQRRRRCGARRAGRPATGLLRAARFHRPPPMPPLGTPSDRVGLRSAAIGVRHRPPRAGRPAALGCVERNRPHNTVMSSTLERHGTPDRL